MDGKPMPPNWRNDVRHSSRLSDFMLLVSHDANLLQDVVHRKRSQGCDDEDSMASTFDESGDDADWSNRSTETHAIDGLEFLAGREVKLLWL